MLKLITHTLALCIAGIAMSNATAADATKGSGALRITSTAFAHNGAIPAKFTCEGSDVSPPLA